MYAHHIRLHAGALYHLTIPTSSKRQIPPLSRGDTTESYVVKLDYSFDELLNNIYRCKESLLSDVIFQSIYPQFSTFSTSIEAN